MCSNVVYIQEYPNFWLYVRLGMPFGICEHVFSVGGWEFEIWPALLASSPLQHQDCETKISCSGSVDHGGNFNFGTDVSLKSLAQIYPNLIETEIVHPKSNHPILDFPSQINQINPHSAVWLFLARMAKPPGTCWMHGVRRPELDQFCMEMSNKKGSGR